MARNKIIYGNETLIDLTEDTAKESDVAQGKTFHKADGSQATGTATGGGTAITPSNSSPVALTKDSSYVIEDNDGYAIESYEDLTIDSSVKTVQSGNLYKPDNTGYVSDCSDLGLSDSYIVYGNKYIGKNGVKYTGSRPKEYLYSANYSSDGSSNPYKIPKIFKFSKSFSVPSLGGYKTIFKSWNMSVELYASSDKKSVLLRSVIPSTGVVSSITIASPGTTYIDSFQITNMHLVHTGHFIIEYSYDTSATARSQTYARSILIKKDGSLAQSSAINTSTASSATTSVESYFMQTLYGDYFSFFCLRSVITDSTGARTLTGWKTWMSTFTGTFTNASSNSINIASNVNTYCPVFEKHAPSKGGFFYTNASGVHYICLIGHYSDSGVKNMTIGDADSSGNLAGFGVGNHYILGVSNCGHLVTAQYTYYSTSYYWYFRLWHLDLSASSDILEYIGYTSLFFGSMDLDILSFNDNILTFSNGYKYQLVEDYASSSNPISKYTLAGSIVETTVINTKFIGTLGDPYNMVGVY